MSRLDVEYELITEVMAHYEVLGWRHIRECLRPWWVAKAAWVEVEA